MLLKNKLLAIVLSATVITGAALAIPDANGESGYTKIGRAFAALRSGEIVADIGHGSGSGAGEAQGNGSSSGGSGIDSGGNTGTGFFDISNRGNGSDDGAGLAIGESFTSDGTLSPLAAGVSSDEIVELAYGGNGRFNADGSITYRDGTTIYLDGRIEYPDGRIVYPNGRIQYPDGTITDALGNPVDSIYDLLTGDIEHVGIPTSNRTLVGFQILTPPLKTEYQPGERFDPTGMIVQVVYSDGTVVRAANGDYSWLLVPVLQDGQSSIVIRYSEGGETVTAEIPVTVGQQKKQQEEKEDGGSSAAQRLAAILRALRISTAPYRTSYTSGDTFESFGLKLYAVYSDGTHKDFVPSVEGLGPLKYGTNTITFSYSDNGISKTVTLDINVTKSDPSEAPSNGRVFVDTSESGNGGTTTVATNGNKTTTSTSNKTTNGNGDTVVTTTGNDGSVTTTTTHADGSTVTVITNRPDGSMETITADANGNVHRVVNKPNGVVETTDSHPDGSGVTVVTKNNNPVETITTTVEPNKKTITTHNDVTGEETIVVTETLPNGDVVTTKITKNAAGDETGCTVSTKTSDGADVVVYPPDPNGGSYKRLEIFPNGDTIEKTYDAGDNLLVTKETKVQPDGGSIVTEKNANGDVTKVTTTEINGNTTTVTVEDGSGNVISTTTITNQPNGIVVTHEVTPTTDVLTTENPDGSSVIVETNPTTGDTVTTINGVDGLPDKIITQTTVGGTTTTTTIDYAADGVTPVKKTVVIDTGTGLTTTVTVYDTDGVTALTETVTVTDTDGNVTNETVTTYHNDGTHTGVTTNYLTGTETTTVCRADDTKLQETVIATHQDGSKTSTSTDYDVDGITVLATTVDEISVQNHVVLRTVDGIETARLTIAITTAPAKTAYTVRDTFDPANMVVTATYADGTAEDVTTDTSIDSADLALSLADVAITLRYTEGGITATTTQAITVSRKTVTITTDAHAAVTYGDTAPTDYVALYDGFFAGDNADSLGLAPTFTGYAQGDAAGDYGILPGGLTDTETYQFEYAAGSMTVQPRLLHVLSGITAANKTYDGTTDATLDASSAVLDNLYGTDSVTVTATGTFATKNAGNDQTVTIFTLTLGGTKADNYTLDTTGNQTTTTANIAPRPVAVSWTGSTSFTYDGMPKLPAAALDNCVAGDSCNLMITGEETNVGNYTAEITAVDNSNYTLTGGTGLTQAFAITPAPAVYSAPTLATTGWTYDSETKDLVAEGTTSHGAFCYSFDNSTWNTARPTAKTAGTYNVYWKLEPDSNHTGVDNTLLGTVTITPKPVTVSGVTATNRAYVPNNTTVSLSGGIVNGVCTGDTVTVDLAGATGTV